MSEPVIRVAGLEKRYGDLEAVRGVDFEVEAGQVFSFLGPNGAGKTTTVEILEGYRRRSAGSIEVLGSDPEKMFGRGREAREWRSRIGVVLQTCRLEPYLTVVETLTMFAGYHREPRSVDEIIDLVGLGESADQRVGTLSGGQERRLDVGIALVGNPDLIFLDEPTTGFDPSARRQAWEMIAGLRNLGTTIFLTTHYMEEAQFLSDTVTIIDGGRIVASGTPAELSGVGADPARITFTIPADGPTIAFESLPGSVEVEVESAGGSVALRTHSPTATLNVLTGWAIDHGIELAELEVRRPTLEDTYLKLTGRYEESEGDRR